MRFLKKKKHYFHKQSVTKIVQPPKIMVIFRAHYDFRPTLAFWLISKNELLPNWKKILAKYIRRKTLIAVL